MTRGVRNLDPPKQTNQRQRGNREAPNVVVDRSPPAAPSDPRRGPANCTCFFCLGGIDPGGRHCENWDHHCESCHEEGRCTKLACRNPR